MKTLVVYCSRTDTTRRVAERLAAALGATLMPITESRSRAGVLGYLRCLFDLALGIVPALDPLPHDPRDYDLVLIGTPIWAWHLASPVRSFVTDHASGIHRAGFFCTMRRSGANAAFAEMEDFIGRPPLATLALSDAEIAAGQDQLKINRFLISLRARFIELNGKQAA